MYVSSRQRYKLRQCSAPFDRCDRRNRCCAAQKKCAAARPRIENYNVLHRTLQPSRKKSRLVPRGTSCQKIARPRGSGPQKSKRPAGRYCSGHPACSCHARYFTRNIAPPRSAALIRKKARRRLPQNGKRPAGPSYSAKPRGKTQPARLFCSTWNILPKIARPRGSGPQKNKRPAGR